MSFKEKIKPFIDKFGLVTPWPAAQGGSGNGVLYSSEYMIELIDRNEYSLADGQNFVRVIRSCMPNKGLLLRAPDDFGNQQQVDDYYGLFAALVTLGEHEIAEDIFQYGLKHYGSFNIKAPYNWTSISFLWRQPQLLYANLCAANRVRWWKFWQLPLAIYSAIIIALSNRKSPVNEVNERCIAYMLVRATRPSFLCRLAAKLWQKRIDAMYPRGMRDVYKHYFLPVIHPLGGD
jgi:hypothetical protein